MKPEDTCHCHAKRYDLNDSNLIKASDIDTLSEMHQMYLHISEQNVHPCLRGSKFPVLE